MDSERIKRLERVIGHELHRNPSGLGEFELISRLRKAGWPEFERTYPTDFLGLFKRHFLLFHILFRLRDRYRQEQVGELAIGALRIVLEPYCSGTEAIATSDPLREYYLDFSQLTSTSEKEVLVLLDGFRGRLDADGEKGSALALMGLSEPVEYAAIKHRYRQLAMRHHPDRGGDQVRLQDLNHAMGVLSRYYHQ
ncbi:DNA-J related domain-containing protein [Thiohalomonas denitrificans]|uniref:DNA-J related protein n=1 Tax=Thiohalomonas denitrificans TaxID=415747 RepID=A0A1G5PKM9_9GAMM|nr:DNA-J related domain-containing protein [Thiohalomonas denitrificans]SCZ50052.1 DNA-J related protein [Thiohalomonas denitrificans]